MTHREYARIRTQLVPIASAYADRLHGTRTKGMRQSELQIYRDKWNKTFHMRMNYLVNKEIKLADKQK